MHPHKLTFLARALAFASIAFFSAAALAQSPDPTPRIGLLVPVHPNDYSILTDALKLTGDVTDGPFVFHAGTISGIPVVYNIAPTEGPLARSLGAEAMIHHFNIKAFIYPGTSGAHLEPSDMRIGDIVLGARNVDFINFFMAPDGHIETGNPSGPHPTDKGYVEFFSDPVLLAYEACSAKRVADATTLPIWLNSTPNDPEAPNNKSPRTHPDIFYYGIQGTGTIWIADLSFIRKIRAVFHEIDEDGDWYSNLVANLYHIPFIEVSAISDSAFEFPKTARGIPPKPKTETADASTVAQRLSNRVTIDMIQHFGAKILTGHYTTPTDDPFPSGVWDSPKDSRTLLNACK